MLSQYVDIVRSLLLAGMTLGALSTTAKIARGIHPRRLGALPVWVGAALGAVGSLVFMVVHLYSLIRFDRQKVTLTTLEPTIALGIITLVVVWLGTYRYLRAAKARALHHDVEGALLSETPARLGITARFAAVVYVLALAWPAALTFRASQVVYLQTRTWVPVGATFFSTPTFYNILGYCLGLATVLVAWLLTARVCQILPRVAFPTTALLILLTTLSHVFLVVRLLNSIRAIYLSPTAVAVMTWMINHEVWLTFLALIVLCGLGIYLAVRGVRTQVSGTNPAARRLVRALNRNMVRSGAATLGVLALSATALAVGPYFTNAEVELSPPEAFTVVDGHVTVPLEQIDDGHLHRFEYETSTGVKVRFIVIRKAGSAYGVGLDACEICGPTGYYEKDGQVICKLCEVAMNIATIGFKGGCNPIPIEYDISNGTFSVPISVLEASASVFA